MSKELAYAPLPCLMYWRRDIFSLLKKMIPVVVEVDNGQFILTGPNEVLLQAPVEEVQVKFTHWATMEVRHGDRLMKLVSYSDGRIEETSEAQLKMLEYREPWHANMEVSPGEKLSDKAASVIEAASDLDFGKTVQFHYLRKRGRVLQEALPMYGVPVRKSGMHGLLYTMLIVIVGLVVAAALTQ